MKASQRICALCLLAALLLPGCAPSKPDPTPASVAAAPESTAAPEETTTEDPNDRSKIKDNVPDGLRFDGQSVRVYYRANGGGENYNFIQILDVVGTDNNGDYVTDGVWERNRRVEDRLGIVFDFIPAEGSLSEVQGMVRNVVTAGLDEYDYIDSTGNTNITQSLNTYLRDLSALPYVNYDEPWWWKNVIRDVSLDGKTFNYLLGDMCIYCYCQTGVVYYNKVLYENLFGDPDEMYSFVTNGTWTVDLLTEKVAAAYADTNGNGVEDAGDVFGMLKTLNQGEETPHFIQGSGIEMYHYDGDGNLIIEFDQERSVLAIEKLGALYVNTPGVFHSDEGLAVSPKYFAEGNILYLPSRIRQALEPSLREMQDPYGILPYPKLTEDQKEYYSLIHNSSTNVSVLKTVADTKMDVLGAAFEALCAESYRSVMPLFLESALKLKYSQDSMSGQVIDMVIGSVSKNTLDEYANYCASIFNTCLRDNITAGRNNFASSYKKLASAAQKTWDKAVANLSK